MPSRIVAIKQAGTHPPVEGLLARIATVCAVRSPEDLRRLSDAEPDIILLDAAMPDLDAGEVLRALRNTSRHPAIILLDSRTQTFDQLVRRLAQLGSLGRPAKERRLSLRQAAKVLGVSQETLARILNVSARTTHRWLKGSRPRRKPELDALLRTAALLREAFPGEEQIQQYLRHRSPALGNERPLDLLVRGQFDRVEADLQALVEGVYI